MQSTCGLSIAASTRSVGLRSSEVCSDATTQSSSASTSSGTSTTPLAVMFASTPRSTRNGSSRALTAVDLAPLLLDPPVAKVVRVIGEAEELVARARRPRSAISSIVALPSADQVEWQCISPRRSPSSTSRGSVPARAASSSPPFSRSSGRDEAVAEEGVQRLLVAERVHLARLDDGDAVLGDREPAPLSLLAQRDVVLLRAGEVLQQVAVALRRHDAEVEPEALLADHGRLRVAVGDDLEHPGQPDEVRGQRGGVGRGRDHVEIAERLATPARAARLGDVDRGRVRPERLDDLADDRKALAEQPAAGLLRALPLGERLRGSSPRSSRRVPASVRSRSCSAASFSSASVVTPSSRQIRAAVFGPRPGSRMNADDLARAPGRAASRAPPCRPSRRPRRSSPRSSCRCRAAPWPCPRAPAPPRTRPCRGSAWRRGGRRATRNDCSPRISDRSASRSSCRPDRRSGGAPRPSPIIRAARMGKIGRCARSSASRPTTSARTSSRWCGRSASSSTRRATACS